MDEHHHHEELIQSITKEYQDILANSEQGIYIYLDDLHKVCNKKFATLLGYQSEDEWAKIEKSFPDVFVADQSQETLISSFQDAMEKNIGSANKIVWKKKDGSTISSTVFLAPISHNGHVFALHFVSN
ncbi:MAG: PAS domain-containing protein [Candidatus Levybacteria bacterium]|nr:PAS domain-containing protein [Candidatus Levybacteria bacterium]